MDGYDSTIVKRKREKALEKVLWRFFVFGLGLFLAMVLEAPS